MNVNLIQIELAINDFIDFFDKLMSEPSGGIPSPWPQEMTDAVLTILKVSKMIYITQLSTEEMAKEFDKKHRKSE